MPPFLLGINYWPRSSAMYMWSRFDIAEIQRDFEYIASLGLSVVRFFLSWEEFQPAADRIDSERLRQLMHFMDALHRHGLQGMPTFFTGHMSGVNWLPEWTLDPRTPHGRFRTIAGGKENAHGIGDFYTGTLLQAQRFQARAVAKHLSGHPALYCWDLGNEFSNLREPSSAQDAAGWSDTLSADLREISGANVTGGIHAEDITRDRNIRPSSICTPWTYATMHGYSVYTSFARNASDPNVVPFLSAITAACANKPVLFSEFGNPTCQPGTVSPGDRIALPGEEPAVAVKRVDASFACLSEDQMVEYGYEVMDRLHAQGALGAMWWCYADYTPQLADQPPFEQAPHELTFGIVRADGTPKPVAQCLAGFATERRRIRRPELPIVDEERYYAALPESLGRTYEQFVSAHETRA